MKPDTKVLCIDCILHTFDIFRILKYNFLINFEVKKHMKLDSRIKM